jgi:hypothetical protein
MGLAKTGDVASRFSAYVEGLTSVIGHANRAKPLRAADVKWGTAKAALSSLLVLYGGQSEQHL